MKYILILILSAILLFSCNKWNDYYYNIDVAPALTFYKNGVLYTDSIDSIKVNTCLSLSYQIASRGEQKLIVNSMGEHDSIVYFNDNTVTFKGISSGNCNINCQVEDDYLKTVQRNFNFIIFDNLPPVASFTYTPINNLSNHEIEFDASSSYDRDARFGGKVILYDFTLDYTVNFQTKSNVIDFSFNSAGTKQVKLRVMDNNNAWSDYLVKNVPVN